MGILLVNRNSNNLHIKYRIFHSRQIFHRAWVRTPRFVYPDKKQTTHTQLIIIYGLNEPIEKYCLCIIDRVTPLLVFECCNIDGYMRFCDVATRKSSLFNVTVKINLFRATVFSSLSHSFNHGLCCSWWRCGVCSLSVFKSPALIPIWESTFCYRALVLVVVAAANSLW